MAKAEQRQTRIWAVINRMIRALAALFVVAVVASCGARETAPQNKFRSYDGPAVTQIVVKKGERRMHLVSGQSVLKSYDIDLGFQPKGHKQFEGDGKTPEGVYFIDRRNPNSAYHLSLGISYPNPQDRANAMIAGLSPGGDIMIHGLGPTGRALNRRDWTAGCIAVTDEEMEEIYAMLRPGVPIFIYP